MTRQIKYLSVDRIVEFNVLVLAFIPVRRGDKAALLNRPRLSQILDKCENADGDIYDKAVVLLQGIIKGHPFASGNRRTALLAVTDFLSSNGSRFVVVDPSQSKVLIGIREGFYTSDEIKEWIKHGTIRPFER